MGVLLLIRTTTEGIADHWIQKIRETGVKTQKLRVSEPLEGDDWHVDGEGLKKKLKAIGMVIIGEEIHSEDVSHEKTVINGLNTQQEVTEHAHTEHHDETHTTHSQTAEDTEKVDNEKVSQTPPPHSPGNFEAHHYEQNEHHVHYDDLQVATEDIGSTEEDRHSRPTNQPPRSPLIGENYRANLDPNRFVSPPWQSTNLPRSRSMPRFVNKRFSMLLASASATSNHHEDTEKSADTDIAHVGQSEGRRQFHTANQENAVAERSSHRYYDYDSLSPRSLASKNDDHQTRNEYRRSATTIRGREEINRGFAEHPVSRRPQSAGPTGPPHLVHFGAPHSNGKDVFHFDPVLSDHKARHEEVAEVSLHVDNVLAFTNVVHKENEAADHHAQHSAEEAEIKQHHHHDHHEQQQHHDHHEQHQHHDQHEQHHNDDHHEQHHHHDQHEQHHHNDHHEKHQHHDQHEQHHHDDHHEKHHQRDHHEQHHHHGQHEQHHHNDHHEKDHHHDQDEQHHHNDHHEKHHQHDHHDQHHHHDQHELHHHEQDHSAIDHNASKLEDDNEKASRVDSTDGESNENNEREQHQHKHKKTATNAQPFWQLYEKDIVFKTHNQMTRKYLTAASSRKIAAHTYDDNASNGSDSD